ncbi:TolC family protein [Acidipila rosea]|uniref:Outer membrane protein TolC n=1 Tax=Acidipila rosea TaxID=768535 RepID=A0A4R1LA58_9BACT|nr:TolC family protein [Acidipila rosea]TCK75235.1 outer membrane protein TolC [Acidipila rosea]
MRRVVTMMFCGWFAASALAQQSAAPDAPGPVNTPPTIAQQAQQAQVQGQAVMPQGFHVELPHSHNPFSAYRSSNVAPLNLSNSPRLQQLVHSGKLYLSLRDVIALALENNLDLAYFRYNMPIAETDLARTKAGGIAYGVNTNVQQGTAGGFGSTQTPSGASGTSSGTNAAGAGGIVTSTLGAGTFVNPFDPQLYVQGFNDHTTQQLVNTVQFGVPLYRQNTTELLSEYSQYFPLGTHVAVDYTGYRQTTNSQFNILNPNLYSNLLFYVSQPVLAGFGLATNERYIHIAKKNIQLTNLGFKAQAIATITQVEDIYWDLVSAYENEQVMERSLEFANKTLDDDRKQLELKAIPAMQVMKDESDVATREGDLTVAKATLKLNELLIKNALTKTIDDPQLEDMPVIPLDRMGAPDENATKPIEALIATAEKNRPDVAMDEIAMQVAQISLRTIKNELLPSLRLYGEYVGNSNGGSLNPACSLGTGCVSNLPTGLGGTLQNTFNYTAPEYQAGFKLNITLRNRIAKADQFRSVLEYRQSELTFEQQKKSIRFDVRNSQFALQQAEAHVDAARKARDLAQKTFDITRQEQQLGAKSSYDTLSAQHDLAVAESALSAAQAAYEKAKIDIDRAVGDTLEHNGISIDDAKSGVVTHM